ncbi:MAG: alpha-glucan family phosphorylase [Vicinamibacteria bacterium]|nr:alpha-glucan family phosphorylase [Vicinamibacteria bacterium]
MRTDTFQVVPAIPEKLAGLREMAFNLLWSWDEELRVVFSRLDRELWNSTNQNPVMMLGLIAQKRLDEFAKDEGFLSFYERTYERFRAYMDESTWWEQRYKQHPRIAYFSAEFGLAECLPMYSGGLGVLAGHHLKSASDLGVPLVGVGLLYQQGYFRQYLTSDGWQHESYPTNDFYNQPVQRVIGKDGTPLRIEMSLAGQRLFINVWQIAVGRLPLFLLDTNVPENPREMQDITDQLYGGDHENRIRQEIVLGMGGLRALHAMGRMPDVCHMNEGHSAFLSLERIRILMQENGLRFPEALEATRAGGVFTTHTPVPAGFDVFWPELMDKYFGQYIHEIGIARRDLLSLGQTNPFDGNSPFNMATLALRTSAFANGVSELHGKISRSLFQKLIPSVPEDEVPVGHVTNGAHTRSCVSREIAQLFDRYLGAEWWRRPGHPTTWDGVDSIPDEELWATHERRRERLVAFARQRLMKQVEQRGGSQRDIERARGVLNTRALTIGFARRFAAYKRGTLLLSDPERLKKILSDPARPVQIIFSGKAHPKDSEGKEMMRTLVNFCQKEDLRRNIVFIEDYDLVVARYLVQGVDIWLNTPRRGMEASGTSGMKVLPNGGLNVSILDGWWCEGYRPEVGWAIGKGESYQDHTYQDFVESNALYDLFENEIVQLFYTRQADGLPRAWIARMKKSLKLTPTFSTNRMLWQYSDNYYLKASQYYADLSAEKFARARALAAWKAHIYQHWNGVRVESVGAQPTALHRVGEDFALHADIRLGAIEPASVAVEIYYGPLNPQRQIVEARTVEMRLETSHDGNVHRYVGQIPCERTGMQGYSVRVRPAHADANSVLATAVMTWW